MRNGIGGIDGIDGECVISSRATGRRGRFTDPVCCTESVRSVASDVPEDRALPGLSGLLALIVDPAGVRVSYGLPCLIVAAHTARHARQTRGCEGCDVMLRLSHTQPLVGAVQAVLPVTINTTLLFASSSSFPVHLHIAFEQQCTDRLSSLSSSPLRLLFVDSTF